MGNSTFTSNVRGNVGINVASLTATLVSVGGTLAVTTSLSVPISTVTSYIKLGNRYIYSGSQPNTASIVAEASALTGIAARAGSLYIEEGGQVWVFNSQSHASPLALQ